MVVVIVLVVLDYGLREAGKLQEIGINPFIPCVPSSSTHLLFAVVVILPASMYVSISLTPSSILTDNARSRYTVASLFPGALVMRAQHTSYLH